MLLNQFAKCLQDSLVVLHSSNMIIASFSSIAIPNDHLLHTIIPVMSNEG